MTYGYVFIMSSLLKLENGQNAIRVELPEYI